MVVLMSDDSLLWNHKPPPPARRPRPAERLFDFVRASDGAPTSAELRFDGESYGWEAQILQRGELFIGRSGFAAWASPERGRVFFAELLEQVRAVPGVEAASLARKLPLAGRSSLGEVNVAGVAPPPGRQGFQAVRT